MTRWRAACGLAVILAASGCGGAATPGPEIAVVPPGVPGAAAGGCTPQYAGATTRVAFLAKEAVPDELAGLRYFVEDWGIRQHCFSGKVYTTLSGIDLGGVDVVVVDISHDAMLDGPDVAALTAYQRSGRRIAVFAWPLALADGSTFNPLAGLPGQLGAAQLSVARGCGDWQYAAGPAAPFPLAGRPYRYENFGGAIFTVDPGGPSTTLAATLFCPAHPGAVISETHNGIVAGFSIAYSVSLADNNVRATGMKELVVDVIHILAGPAPR